MMTLTGGLYVLLVLCVHGFGRVRFFYNEMVKRIKKDEGK